MTEAISEIRQVSGHTSDSMNNIFKKLTEMGSSFASIKGTIDMQSINSGQILEALRKIRKMADEVNSGSGRIKNDSTAIDNIVRKLRSASEEMSTSVNVAQNSSKQIATSFSMAKKIVDGKIIVRPDQNQ